MNPTIEKVYNDLEQFRKKVESSKIANEIEKNLTKDVASYPSIKTRKFINAINTHEVVVSGGSHFEIGAMDDGRVTYDGFLEFTTANRDGSYRDARFHYAVAIKNTDFHSLINEMADEAFVI